MFRALSCFQLLAIAGLIVAVLAVSSPAEPSALASLDLPQDGGQQSVDQSAGDQRPNQSQARESATEPLQTGAKDAARQFQRVQRKLAQKIRSGVDADRMEVMIDLRNYPVLPAARMAIGALDDADQKVREAAHETLVSFHQDPRICRHFLSTLREDALRSGWTATSYTLLTALAMTSDPAIQAEVVKLVDAHATVRPNNMTVLNSVLDGLGERGDELALSALRTLTHCDLLLNDFGVRRGLVQAIIAIRAPESVDTLLKLMPNIDGEVQGDAIKYLSALSGERYGGNLEAWDAWWEKNRDGFEFPSQLTSPKEIMAAFAAEGTSTYYDLPIFARRLVFVIDSSASMRKRGRMDAAKLELIDAVNSLDEETSFGIVAFNSSTGAWQRVLQKATTPAKASAAMWINSLEPINYTASYDALEATFGFKNLEAIYFVSDGAPTVGKIVDKDEIVGAVREGNRTRRVTIYTIGIEPDEDKDNTFEGFLKTLAEENYGLYRPVGKFGPGGNR